ncbi:MAG: TonB-dependent receptor [Alcaligenaceae bacterium]|nr:TonB-dependent receptor [Alcaligenaceae bacterium]
MKKTILAIMIGSMSLTAYSAEKTVQTQKETKEVIQKKKEQVAGKMLDQINVTAGYAEVNRLKSSKNVIVIEAKDIRGKGYQTVEDVLNDIPSINVGSTEWGEIDIRGQGEDQAGKNIQVMLDGAPITTLVSHPMKTNYNVVPVENIEKIEIVPSGGSVVYGSGSVGGVVNITTNLKNIHRTKKDISVGIGSNHKAFAVNLGHNFTDKFSAQASYSYKNQQLYFKDTYRKSHYFTLGMNYKITDRQNVSFRYSGLVENGQFIKQLQNQNLDKLGRDYVPKEQKHVIGLDENNHKIEEMVSGYLKADRQIHSLNATYTGHYDHGIKYNIDAFYNTGYFTNTNDGLVMKTNTVGMKNKVDVEYGQDGVLDGSRVLVGLDLFHQNAKFQYNDYKLVSWRDKTYKEKPLSFKYDKTTFALYALNSLRYKQLEFSQGIRADMTFWGFDKVASKNSGKATSFRPNLNLELALAYHYRDTGRVYARYEHSFTAPDGLQITDDFSTQNIMPTKAKDTIYDMVEIGWKDQFDWFGVEATAFYNHTNNEMSRNLMMDPDLGFGRKSINVLKTSRGGIEFTLSQKWKGLTLEQSYAWLKGVRKYNGKESEFIKPDAIVDWTNAGLKKVPQHSLTLKAKYQFNDQWSISGKYKYSGAYTNFVNEKDFKEDCYKNYWGNLVCTPPKFESKDEAYIKSRSVVDINISYQNEKGFSASAGINNLFNEKYYEYSGGGDAYSTVTPAEGRSFYLRMKYAF